MSLLIVFAFVRFYSYQADFSCAERLDINLKKNINDNFLYHAYEGRKTPTKSGRDMWSTLYMGPQPMCAP